MNQSRPDRPHLFPYSYAKKTQNMCIIMYGWAMVLLESYLDKQLAKGRTHFCKEEGRKVSVCRNLSPVEIE
jgi:hypothetical protein